MANFITADRDKTTLKENNILARISTIKLIQNNLASLLRLNVNLAAAKQAAPHEQNVNPEYHFTTAGRSPS